MDRFSNCETHESDVREMLKEDCIWYKGHELSKIVKTYCGGRIYRYNGREYSVFKCKDVCDLYEKLFGFRPIAIKCSDGKYVIFANHYRAHVRNQTIELCEKILSEV